MDFRTTFAGLTDHPDIRIHEEEKVVEGYCSMAQQVLSRSSLLVTVPDQLLIFVHELFRRGGTRLQ